MQQSRGLLFVLFLGVCLATLLQGAEGIVGGTVTNISDAPFMGGVVHYAGEGSNRHYYLVCGCVAINSMWYLTSFTCIQRGGSKFSDQIRMDAIRPSVAFGYSERETLTDHHIRRRIINMQKNPDYPEVALLRLHVNISFSNGDLFPPGVNESESAGDEPYWAAPIAGIVTEPPATGDNLTFYGWGAVQTDGTKQSKVLLSATLPLRNATECGFKEDKHLCLGETNPEYIGGCRSDVGGPLVNQNGELVGIFMHHVGSSFSSPCDGYSKFIRADLIRNWVLNVTSDLKQRNNGFSLQPTLFILAILALLALF